MKRPPMPPDLPNGRRPVVLRIPVRPLPECVSPIRAGTAIKSPAASLLLQAGSGLCLDRRWISDLQTREITWP